MSSAAVRRSRKPLAGLFAPLMLAALACSFGRPLAPTVVPVATPTLPPEASATVSAPATPLPPEPTPSALPSAAAVDPAVPAALLDAVLERIDSGEWTPGEGIVAGLRYFVGEAGADEQFGAQTEITAVEGSGLIRLAQDYLETGDDPAAKAELERLLLLIRPPLERLMEYAEPAPINSAAAAAGHPRRARPAAQASEELCRDLWEDSFPIGTDAVCFQYAAREIGGHTHTVYYPAYWPADDPRRAYLDLYLEALETALAVFNTYGPNTVGPVIMVLTELPGRNEAGELDERIYAMAGSRVSGGTCDMGVFPAAVSQAPAAFQQTIAHELFHCYQFANLHAQVHGPAARATTWWVEGSAEFFGNVVYPTTNDEFQFIADFDSQSLDHSLLSMSYGNFLWFQYMAHGAGLGTDGVLGLLRALPTAGSFPEQRQSLAAFPGMEDLFHNFARAYLDHAIIDTGGGLIPVDPQRGADYAFALGASEASFQPAFPFLIVRYQLHWEDEASFALTLTTTGVGRSAVRAPGTPGLWSALPEVVGTACAGTTHLLLVTTTEAAAAEPAALQVAYTGEEASGCDNCLVGHWALVNESYVAFLNSLQTPDSAIEYTAANGTTIFNFKDDGVSSTQHEGFVVEVIHQEALDGSALDLPLTMALSGGSEARYAASEGRLTFSEGQYNVTADMNMNGIPLTDFVFNDADFGLGAGEANYTCVEDALTYRPLFPGRETTRVMDFMRVESP